MTTVGSFPHTVHTLYTHCAHCAHTHMHTHTTHTHKYKSVDKRTASSTAVAELNNERNRYKNIFPCECLTYSLSRYWWFELRSYVAGGCYNVLSCSSYNILYYAVHDNYCMSVMRRHASSSNFRRPYIVFTIRNLYDFMFVMDYVCICYVYIFSGNSRWRRSRSTLYKARNHL